MVHGSATTAPEALAWSTANCQVEAAMGVLGERGVVVVLREIFNGVRRFDDIRRHSGLSRQVLTDRLVHLMDEGLLTKTPYREQGARERHEYRPTPKALDLYPVLTAIAAWGEQYYSGPGGPAVLISHLDCGSAVSVSMSCEAGHHDLDHRSVAPRPGPGARRLPDPSGQNT